MKPTSKSSSEVLPPTHSDVWQQVDQYFNSELIDDDPIFDFVMETARKRNLPEISVSKAQGKFLNMLVSISGAKNVLEIGTLAGYSTIWMAKALPRGGKVITIEAFSNPMAGARENFKHAGLFENPIDLRFGYAHDVLPEIHEGIKTGSLEKFDMAFIDADKGSYPEYYQMVIKMMNKGGIIIADNVVRRGEVVNETTEDVNVPAIKNFTEMVGKDPRVQAVTMQTVGEKGYDGFMIVRVL